MNLRRIAIVVQGRFHMFDLARELARLGHSVTLFTNYPASVVRRFGCRAVHVVSYLAHGVGFRVLSALTPKRWSGSLDEAYVQSFANWARTNVPKRGPFDVVISMSGVAKELFEVLPRETVTLLHRGSTHIREQQRLLDAESIRTGRSLEKPTEWMSAREEAEYRLATNINVLSPLAYESFVKFCVPEAKLNVLSLGVDVKQFANTPQARQGRIERIRSDDRLRLLCVGSFSLRKGAALWDEFLASTTARHFKIRFVGDIGTDARDLYRRNRVNAEFIQRLPQQELPRQYAWADLFALPSVEDGFAAVVLQALASGLPVLTTSTCGASSLINQQVNGWVVPPSSLSRFEDQLADIGTNRDRLATMCEQLPLDVQQHDWSHMALAVQEQMNRLKLAKAA